MAAILPASCLDLMQKDSPTSVIRALTSVGVPNRALKAFVRHGERLCGI